VSKLKKVLLVLNDTGRGGSETQALYLAKGLIVNDYTVDVLSFGSKKGPYWDDFESLGIEMHLTHFNSKLLVQTNSFSSKINAIRFAIKFIRQIRKINAEVIIPFTYFPNVITGMYWRFTKAKICVWNQRDGGIMFNGTTKEVSALENATIIVSNSLEGSLFLEKYTNRTISIIHNGIVLPDFKKIKQSSKIRVVMVANLSSYKNHIELLKSWKIVTASSAKDRIELFLAGTDGDASKSITDYIVTNELIDSVHCLGMISNVSELLASSDIGVFSSIKEGLPNGILECMAAGLPVIATKINGSLESLGADYPFLVEPYDVDNFARMLSQLIEDSELRVKIGKQNRKRIEEHFQMEQMVSKYVGLINSKV
jgi:glycosyltransferase involved in cell wall biosynthesis